LQALAWAWDSARIRDTKGTEKSMRRNTKLAQPAPLTAAEETFVKVAGYQLTKRLHESARAAVYGGRRESDGRPVILKVLQDDSLTAQNIASYQHEWRILQRLEGEGVIRAYELRQERDVVALVTEDFGGASLKDLMSAKPAYLGLTGNKLKLALKLVTALRDVHAANIIHKDINPNNIIINTATGALKLIDFGLATELPREQAGAAVPAALLGTLPYIAPEQTGRMNRAVDYRSDFYSLGATLYELFAGQPPFNSNDPLEVIHCHIARAPTPPHKLNAEVPETVSAILLKLLAKTAEERYQSVWSLEADLAECVKQWQTRQAIEPFPIDQSLVCDRFQLPQKLYGRQKELEALLQAFDRASTGKSEALFVTGHSGIGKTSLVREVYKPITAKRGYFVSGKFDQFQRNIPYSAVLAALGEFVRQILSESEARIAHWRGVLHEALGSNGRVLTELLPELELVIGAQPPLPPLAPAQVQERFGLVMRKFFGALCQPEHPLVLYIDDLQWADSASIGLLLRLLSDEDLKFFLFIGAYRDDEVDAAHPVMLARGQLHRQGVSMGELALTPLGAFHIGQMIVEALHVAEKEAAPLAARVHEKTGGNPFFVDEFLKSLHAKGLIAFDAGRRSWRWDLEAIESQSGTDNVIDLMARNIRELSESAQHCLRLAACLGGESDTGTLAALAELSAEQVAADLHQASVRGFIVASGAAHRFAHDRVRQAAYGLIPQGERGAVHYRIGRLLLDAAAPAELEKNRFAIVNHLNLGKAAADAAESTELAELNLAAGRQAKASAVYDVALAYFKAGIEVLGQDAWEKHYELALPLFLEAAQAAALCNDRAGLQAYFEEIRARGRTALEKAPAYETKIDAETRWADFPAAVATGFEALSTLGIRYPKKPTALHEYYYEARVRLAMRGRTPNALLDLPPMTDPLRLAQARIMRALILVFYWSNNPCRVISLHGLVHLCIRHGNPPFAPIIYSSYAMLVCEKDVERSYLLGKLAVALADKLDAKAQRPMVLSIAATLCHWKEHCREALAPLLETYRIGLEVGDLYSAGQALMSHGYLSFHAGERLAPLHQALQGYAQTLVKSLKVNKGAEIVIVYRDLVGYLSGQAQDAGCLSEAVDGAKPQDKVSFSFHACRAILALHFGDYQKALRQLQEARKYAHTVRTTLHYWDLYEGIARSMVQPLLSKEEQEQNKKAIVAIRNDLQSFAAHSPSNYTNKAHLIEAELARLDGDDPRAERYYEMAVAAAKEHGFTHEEALAAELAGRYWLGRGVERFAQVYLRHAHALYTRWGAIRKAEWLAEQHPRFRLAGREMQPAAAGTIGAATAITADTSASLSFDSQALMKALKSVTEETVHTQILAKTMHSVMQFAGAEKAMLLLRGAEEGLFVEADLQAEGNKLELLKSIPFEKSDRLCPAVVNYARRTKANVVVHDAGEPQSVIPGLANDPYIKTRGVKSILCIPFMVGAGVEAELIGLLYVENNQSSHAFTERRVGTLEIICLAAAGRLELSRKAVTDFLTGLYNRAYFDSALRKEFSLAKRKSRPMSLVMVDIDFFKKFNDQWGHQVGDMVLRHVAQTLKEACRDSDIVARYGGEEMVVVLPETPGTSAFEVAERIRQMIETRPLQHGEHSLKVTASLGVATNTEQMLTQESLIEAADQALYRSKESGRNRVTVG
jgi:histidine kinase